MKEIYDKKSKPSSNILISLDSINSSNECKNRKPNLKRSKVKFKEHYEKSFTNQMNIESNISFNKESMSLSDKEKQESLQNQFKVEYSPNHQYNDLAVNLDIDLNKERKLNKQKLTQSRNNLNKIKCKNDNSNNANCQYTISYNDTSRLRSSSCINLYDKYSIKKKSSNVISIKNNDIDINTNHDLEYQILDGIKAELKEEAFKLKFKRNKEKLEKIKENKLNWNNDLNIDRNRSSNIIIQNNKKSKYRLINSNTTSTSPFKKTLSRGFNKINLIEEKFKRHDKQNTRYKVCKQIAKSKININEDFITRVAKDTERRHQVSSVIERVVGKSVRKIKEEEKLIVFNALIEDSNRRNKARFKGNNNSQSKRNISNDNTTQFSSIIMQEKNNIYCRNTNQKYKGIFNTSIINSIKDNDDINIINEVNASEYFENNHMNNHSSNHSKIKDIHNTVNNNSVANKKINNHNISNKIIKQRGYSKDEWDNYYELHFNKYIKDRNLELKTLSDEIQLKKQVLIEKEERELAKPVFADEEKIKKITERLYRVYYKKQLKLNELDQNKKLKEEEFLKERNNKELELIRKIKERKKKENKDKENGFLMNSKYNSTRCNFNSYKNKDIRNNRKNIPENPGLLEGNSNQTEGITYIINNTSAFGNSAYGNKMSLSNTNLSNIEEIDKLEKQKKVKEYFKDRKYIKVKDLKNILIEKNQMTNNTNSNKDIRNKKRGCSSGLFNKNKYKNTISIKAKAINDFSGLFITKENVDSYLNCVFDQFNKICSNKVNSNNP